MVNQLRALIKLFALTLVSLSIIFPQHLVNTHSSKGAAGAAVDDILSQE